MRYRFKILTAIALSLFVSFFIFQKIDTPEKLAKKTRSLILNNFIAQRFIPKELIFKQRPLGIINNNPVIKKSYAEEKKVIIYKGKRLEFFVDDPQKETPKELLEFFYQLELLKKQN